MNAKSVEKVIQKSLSFLLANIRKGETAEGRDSERPEKNIALKQMWLLIVKCSERGHNECVHVATDDNDQDNVVIVGRCGCVHISVGVVAAVGVGGRLSGRVLWLHE